MKAHELIARLQELDAETDVRLMTQPAWPFEWSIAGLWSPDGTDPDTCTTFRGASDDCDTCGVNVNVHPDEPRFTPHDATGPVVYLVEGSQLAYGTKDAFAGGERW